MVRTVGVNMLEWVEGQGILQIEQIVKCICHNCKNGFVETWYDQSGNGNKEEVISFENDIDLEKWINTNLLVK